MRSIDDILKDHPEVKGFIISQDESGIYLLDFGDFPDKMESFEEVEKISVLKGLRSLLYTRALSQEYLKKEWSNFNFERYLEREMQNIYDNEYRSSLNKIIKAIDEIVNSDITKSQKINKLLRYKELFSGPFINDTDYSAKDVVSYADLKISILEKQEMPPSTTQKISSDIPNEPNPENHPPYEIDFPEIFKKGGYRVFMLLNEKYTKSDKKLPSKYSYLFHYLKYEGLLNCTQLEYIDFIKREYKITLSKIQPETYKYGDDIQPLLMRYHKGQQ